MNDWEEHITIGNRFFKKEDYPMALAHYSKSLNCVMVDLPNRIQTEPECVIKSVLISYFNMADTHCHQYDFEDAALQYAGAYRFVQRLLNSCNCCLSEQARCETMKACNRLYHEWSKFISKHVQELSETNQETYAHAHNMFTLMFSPTTTLH